MSITLTPKAIAAVKAAQVPGDDVLRVAIVGGGCSGYSYALNFEKEEEFDEDDDILDFDGITVRIDPHSANMLQSTIIDYVETMMNKGFVFNNPKAKTTCGCGSSFSY
jgi:iron-sulfur cluster assembly accessory protein